MERHLAIMCFGYAAKLALQIKAGLRRLILAVGNALQSLQHFLRGSYRGLQGSLHLSKDILAFVHTADQVVGPRCNAIGRSLQVIWDEDLFTSPTGCLIQRSQLTQVSL